MHLFIANFCQIFPSRKGFQLTFSVNKFDEIPYYILKIQIKNCNPTKKINDVKLTYCKTLSLPPIYDRITVQLKYAQLNTENEIEVCIFQML